MLSLFVAQQPTPIHVTIQQPPGLPIWLTAAIGASVGAVFAIVTNTAMEFLKPKIASCITKRIVERELAYEVLANLGKVETALYIIKDAYERRSIFLDKALETIPLLLSKVHNDSYTQYFEKEKRIVHQIDRGRNLQDFYEAERHLSNAFEVRDLGLIQLACMLMQAAGEKYAKVQGLPIPSIDAYWRDMYLNMPDDGTLPVLPSDSRRHDDAS
jgi:hypothetical protein